MHVYNNKLFKFLHWVTILYLKLRVKVLKSCSNYVYISFINTYTINYQESRELNYYTL